MKTIFRAVRVLGAVALVGSLAACGGGSDTTSVSLGGTVTGLTTGSVTLTSGTLSVTIPANSTTFAFGTRIGVNAAYDVQLKTAPADTTCRITNGSGTAGSTDITNIQVACVPDHALGGTIAGLIASGLVLTNGSDTVSPAANSTSFVFPKKVGTGFPYGVTILSQPTGQTCSVQNATGLMGATDVTNVAVTCI